MSAVVWSLMSLLLIAVVITGILGFGGVIPIAVFVVMLLLYFICSIWDCYRCAKIDFNSDLDAFKTVVANKNEHSEKFWANCLRRDCEKMILAPVVGSVRGVGITLYCLIVGFLIFFVAPIVCFFDNLEWRKKHR